MKALRIHQPEDLRLDELPIPDAAPGQVLVKVAAAAICGSDKRWFYTGTHQMPLTLGHEFSGTVVEAAGTPAELAGRAVSVIPLTPCGECDQCRAGLYNLCSFYGYLGSRSDGGFADYALVPSRSVVPLSDDVPVEVAALVDPFTVALHAIRMVGFRPGDDVAVIGVGTLGLAAIQWLRVFGAGSVLAIDINSHRRGRAEASGAQSADSADVLLNPAFEQVVSRVINFTDSPAVLPVATRIARKHGVITNCGIAYKDMSLPAKSWEQLQRKELTINAAWNYVFSDVPENEWLTTLRFLGRKLLDPAPLITHRFSIEDGVDAFAMAMDPDADTVGVLIVPGLQTAPSEALLQESTV